MMSCSTLALSASLNWFQRLLLWSSYNFLDLDILNAPSTHLNTRSILHFAVSYFLLIIVLGWVEVGEDFFRGWKALFLMLDMVTFNDQEQKEGLHKNLKSSHKWRGSHFKENWVHISCHNFLSFTITTINPPNPQSPWLSQFLRSVHSKTYFYPNGGGSTSPKKGSLLQLLLNQPGVGSQAVYSYVM